MNVDYSGKAYRALPLPRTARRRAPGFGWRDRAPSVKVARACGQLAEKGRLIEEYRRDQVHALAFALEGAVYGQEIRAQQLLALPLGEVAPDDHVDHSGLVLQGHESD